MVPRLESRTHCIGVLTSGGDCPGLNAAIRGVTRAAIQDYHMKVVGIRDVPLDHDWIDSARRVGTCLGVTDAALLELMGTR